MTGFQSWQAAAESKTVDSVVFGTATGVVVLMLVHELRSSKRRRAQRAADEVRQEASQL